MDENDFDMFADMEQEYNEDMLDLENEINQEDYTDGVDDDFFTTQQNNSQEEDSQTEPSAAFTIPDMTTDDIKSKITDEQMQQNQPEQQQTPATAPSQPVQPTQTEKLEQQVSEHSEQPQPVQPTPVQPTQQPVQPVQQTQPVQPTQQPVQPIQQPPVNPRRTAMEQQQQKVTQEAPFSVVDTKQSALQQPDNSCVIASQGGYQQGQTYETQQQAMYNTTSPSVPQKQAVPQAVPQTVQKNNEQKTEEPKLSSEEMQKVKLFCKKIAVFFIALMIIVGIPIMLFKVKNNNPKPKDSIPGETTVETNPDDLFNDDWYDPFSYNDPTTTAITETTTEIQTEAPTEEPTEASSGRFDTLDELTVYIESNQGLILSGMQMAEIQLQNNEISHDEYIKQINTYITAANELNNLILANSSVYSEEGQQDKYNSLVQSMNSVIVYGATAITK